MLGAVDPPEYDRLSKLLQQQAPLAYVSSDGAEWFGNRRPSTFSVNHAKVIDRLQLAEVTHEDHRHITEGGVVRVLGSFAEVFAPPLLHTEVHTCK